MLGLRKFLVFVEFHLRGCIQLPTSNTACLLYVLWYEWWCMSPDLFAVFSLSCFSRFTLLDLKRKDTFHHSSLHNYTLILCFQFLNWVSVVSLQRQMYVQCTTKVLIPIQKAFGEKKLAPRFGPKSINIIHTYAP